MRHVRIKAADGTETEVEEYYHRFAVALLIDERFDLLLDFEPLLPKDLRPITAQARKQVSKPALDEGALTSACALC